MGNEYVKNLNRIEFVVTYACTGRCRHCSQGEHRNAGAYIDAEVAAKVVREVASKYKITSMMTFGGEPLLCPEVVYAAHKAAVEMNIPQRHLITNGFFAKDSGKIREVAENLAKCGVNKILLSVDAFHQEFIPIDPVKEFALRVKEQGILLYAQPAWLVNREHKNPYNECTCKLLEEFEEMGILQSYGNDIIPTGNALKYLSEYYDMSKEYISPYEEDPTDVRTISVEPNGDVLGGNIYAADVLEILERYSPDK